jgi:hypothetical protein
MTPWITKPVPFNIGQGAAAAGAGGCTGGDDLEMFSVSGSYGNFGANYLFIQRSLGTNGIIDECYDQIAVKAQDPTSGNIRLGVYDDDGTDPDALYATTGSIALYDDYSFKPITEFTLTTVRTWLAVVKSEASYLFQSGSVETGDEVWASGVSGFPALPDPATGSLSVGSECRQMKIGHS